jgi:hypothetical protein
MPSQESKGPEVVGANWHCGWRCECESVESTVERINKALSASRLGVSNTILESAGGPTTLPRESKVGEGVGANWHCGWRCEFQSFESTIAPINEALSASLLNISNAIVSSPRGPTTLPRGSKVGEGEGANWGSDGDPNLNRLKAPLNQSMGHFQRVF